MIAPGLEAMTDYLHQRTALLPKISLLEPPGAIGKSTKDAMLAGAVYGYRGLVRQILQEIAKELKIAAPPPGRRHRRLRGIRSPPACRKSKIQPELTLEGLRMIGNLNR